MTQSHLGPRVALMGMILESNRCSRPANRTDFESLTWLGGNALMDEARKEAPTIAREFAAFVAAMAESEGRQLDAFVAFLKRLRLDDELRAHDWAAFARGDDGEGPSDDDADGEGGEAEDSGQEAAEDARDRSVCESKSCQHCVIS